jgi:hypothetical protein
MTRRKFLLSPSKEHGPRASQALRWLPSCAAAPGPSQSFSVLPVPREHITKYNTHINEHNYPKTSRGSGPRARWHQNLRKLCPFVIWRRLCIGPIHVSFMLYRPQLTAAMPLPYGAVLHWVGTEKGQCPRMLCTEVTGFVFFGRGMCFFLISVFYFYYIIIVLRVHCVLYKSSYNVSWLNSPPPSLSFTPHPFLE